MGTRWNRLAEAVLTREQKYVKYKNNLSENFHFLVVKFSVYLNRERKRERERERERDVRYRYNN